MRKLLLSFWLVASCFAAGCGSEPTPPRTRAALTPLSTAQWRQLPTNEKYEEATFDRLKMQDPQLKNDRMWYRFMIETVIPERKKDLPGDMPG